MKITSILAVLAATLPVVFGAPAETNADRLSRGLPPLPPVRRGTPANHARSAPSNIPPPPPQFCLTGPIQCCQSAGTPASSPTIGVLAGLLGISVGNTVLCGLTCSPLAAGAHCATNSLCCKNNSFNGIIAVDCTPATL
ncbi:hydrophobin [Pluteus cervinus]|uniref:Hydrophobin n=1 Tax=Pluteus cervinus TaxID=181527 RepID=A0ACD3AP89_9AGAR|nr:hydrophobin [Pluteus cervinus]